MEFNPTQTSQMQMKDKVYNLCWRFVNKTLFRITPTYFAIFRRFRVAVLKLFGAHLDWSVSIHPSANIEYPWNLTMKDKSSLGQKCWIYAMAPIYIGKKTCIGKDVYLLTGSHDIEKSTFDLITYPIYIGDNTWIATDVTVLPNVIIGNFCVVATGAVVAKNVEDHSVVGGNPAKFIKKRIIKE